MKTLTVLIVAFSMVGMAQTQNRTRIMTNGDTVITVSQLPVEVLPDSSTVAVCTADATVVSFRINIQFKSGAIQKDVPVIPISFSPFVACSVYPVAADVESVYQVMVTKMTVASTSVTFNLER